MQTLADKPSLDPIFDRFVDEFVSTCPPLLRGQMNQMRSLAGLSADSTVGARPSLIFYLRHEGDFVLLECYGRTIKFPARAREAIYFSMGNSEIHVRDIPALDDAGKQALVRRLIREGLLQKIG